MQGARGRNELDGALLQSEQEQRLPKLWNSRRLLADTTGGLQCKQKRSKRLLSELYVDVDS